MVEKEEDIPNAALREAKEETFDLFDVKLTDTSVNRTGTKFVSHLFLAHVKSSDESLQKLNMKAQAVLEEYSRTQNKELRAQTEFDTFLWIDYDKLIEICSRFKDSPILFEGAVLSPPFCLLIQLLIV